MDEHDEAFEAIPWDRFTREPRFDPRLALAAVIIILAVGVGAFAIRRASVPQAVAAPPVAPTPVTTTVPIGTSTTVEDAAGLWAPEPEPPAPDGVAARFLADLLAASGIRVSSVIEIDATHGADGSVVAVEALGTSDGGDPVRLGMEVHVGSDGTVLRWEPGPVGAVEVRPLVEGAVPPPDVLDGMSRTVARWGTALDVVRSGIDGDQWWAEFLVGLPGGAEVLLVVWEA